MKGLKIVKLEDAIQILRTHSEMDYPIRLLEKKIDKIRKEIDGVFE